MVTGAFSKWNGVEWDTAAPKPGCLTIYDMHVQDSSLYVIGTISSTYGCLGDRAMMFDGTAWKNLYLSETGYGWTINLFNEEIIAGTNFDNGYNGDTINYIAHFLGYPTEVVSAPGKPEVISPNPASTTIQFHLSSVQPTDISVFNLLGEKVKEEKVTSKEVTMDVSELPKGMYVVRSKEGMIGKFVKE